MKKILIMIFLLILFNCINVQADSTENQDIKNPNGVEDLYNYISGMKSQYDLLKDIDVKSYISDLMKSGKDKITFKQFYNEIFTYMFKETASSLKLIGTIMVISVICALLNNLQAAFSNESITNIAYFACYALLIMIIAKSFYIGIDLAVETIKKLSDFMAALIPVLMLLLVSVGSVAEYAVMDPIIIGTINLSTRIYINFIIPIICMSFVLGFVSNISKDYKIDKLNKMLNGTALWVQGIIMTLFIGIISIRGMTTKTIDQVTVKTAKFAIDTFVPVVGKCLSDAVSTVAGYSILLKNALSSLGLIIILIMVMFPIIKLLIIAFMYKLSAAIIQPISDMRLTECLNSAGNSLILVSSCLISVSVMFFIMISIVAAAGKAAIGG